MDAINFDTKPDRKLKSKVTSPCIGVCKYTDGKLCRGCTMTKPEKKAFKKLKGKKVRAAFVQELMGRLVSRGRYPKWARAYRNRCQKKGSVCVLDALEPSLGLADSRQPFRPERRA
ncbi:MAG: DUF1289 domain-containing protein [Pseudomonadota bacterium]